MASLLILLPLSLALVGVAAVAFLWAVDREQFNDLERHAFDLLEEEDGPEGGPQ